MNKNIRIMAVIVTVAAILFGVYLMHVPKAVAQVTETIAPMPQIVQMTGTKDILSFRQRTWLGALIWCESKATASAINKVDRDGTPSYGLLQFKPGTFRGFMKQYGLGTSTDHMDPELQQRIVEQMIIRNDVKWSKQFPECTRKLGVPPRV